jgi:hypothetical protein
MFSDLLSSPSKAVVMAALDLFRAADDLVADAATLNFLNALASPTVDLAGAPSAFIVDKLQMLLPQAAGLVGAIALKLVRAWRAELNDIRTSTAGVAPELTDLAITLHRLGGKSREDGVTIFEALVELDALGARDTLREIDNRFDIQGPSLVRPRRPRTRRTRKRQRRGVRGAAS